jgi:hypothetical protein
MAQAYAREKFEQNPEQEFSLKVEGVPADTNLRTEDDIVKRVF